jgi:RsiW-degrading membrane proteinase PrsW (M82 family)
MAWVRIWGPSLCPALLLVLLLWLTEGRGADEPGARTRREPLWLLLGVFGLGVLARFGTNLLEGRAAAWTGLDAAEGPAGPSGAGSLLFAFGFAAPVAEAAKVAAMWPAFRSRWFDEPLDGVVYATCSALGFAALESVLVLRAHPSGAIWILRTLVALPAHVFFACVWGYALGRAKRAKRPGAMFPLSWFVATVVHGLYVHLVYGRGSGALVATVPLLVAMAWIAFFAVRDLGARAQRSSRTSMLLERVSSMYLGSGPPSLGAVRDAMRRDGQRITFRWILFGALVTLGAMTLGLVASIVLGHVVHVDFSTVDEHDVATTAPVALLGSGVLFAFPLSGFLVARASSVPTLLEPALASGLAILVTLVLLGLAAPVVLIFALAFSPIAWGLACAGAWVGRTS